MRIYKNALCLMFRSKILSITLLLLTVFIGWDLISSKERLAPNGALGNAMTHSIFIFIIVMFVSFEYMKKLYNTGVSETILITSKGRNRKDCLAAILVLMTYSLLVSVMVCAIVMKQYLFFRVQDPNNEYKIHIIQCVILHIFLVADLAIVIGATLAKISHRMFAYVVMTFFSLMCCPFSSNIAQLIFTSCKGNWQPGRIAYGIASNFFIVPRFDTKWPVEEPYGESLMFDRICMIGFWMFFFFTVNCILSKRCKKYAVVFGGIAIALILTYHSPIARMSYGLDPFYSGEPDWILARKYKNKDEKADYKITAYDMELSMNTMLSAKVNMRVSKSLEHYKMTLYNRYKVTKVTNQDGKKLDYRQKENYLDIYNKDKSEVTNIIIRYCGSDINHYTSYQCCFLPGYFLYYPRAGYIPVYNEIYGYVYYNLVNEDTQFRVKVNSPEKYISNLPLKNGAFVGKCDGFTLVKGFFKKKDLGNGNILVYPYLDQWIRFDGKKSEEECWEEYFEESRKELAIDNVKNKILFFDSSIDMNQGWAFGKDQFFIQSYPVCYYSGMMPEEQSED